MSAGEMTQLINRAAQGERVAAGELWTLIYGDARMLAAGKLKGQNGQARFDVTVAVHEAYIRMEGAGQRRWENRRHFFGALARAMTEYLIDEYRRNHAKRRLAPIVDFSISRIAASMNGTGEAGDIEGVVQRLESLRGLEGDNEQAANAFRLHTVLGHSHMEVARSLQLASAEESVALVRYAKAWLRGKARLGGGNGE